MSFSEFLKIEVMGNTMLQVCMALGTALLTIIIAEVLKSWFVKHFGKLAEKTTNDLDDFVVRFVRSTKFFFILIVGLVIGAQLLSLPENYFRFINGALVISTGFQSIIWASQLIEFFISSMIRREELRTGEQNPGLITSMGAIRLLLRVIIFSILLLLAVDNLGYDVTALLTGLGVGGIAVALAVQNILGDLFGSLSIMFDKPFVVGDFVVVGDMAGNVEKIGLKSTRIRSLSGEQLVFSNADLLGSRIRNYKRMTERRIVFEFGVIYQTKKAQLEQIPAFIKKIVDDQVNARFDRAHFKAFGASSLDFEVVYYVNVPDYTTYMDIQQSINMSIFGKFEEEGIEFAYPTQTLFLENTEAAQLEKTGTA